MKRLSINISRAFFPLLLLGYSLLGSQAMAEVVEIEVAPGRVATAEFHRGEADAPVVLILHGFLQTREYMTVVGLGEALAESGMTVLMPTLSLGISRRQRSLVCEAIHTHSMEKDVAEVEEWIEWLHQRTGRKVTLIGHSAGSLQLLSYLSSHDTSPVERSILISLAYFGQGRASHENPADAAIAEHRLLRGDRRPVVYGLAYCPRYISPPAEYLSYYQWNKRRTLEALAAVEVPTTVILGEEDRLVDRDWISLLRSKGISVIAVKGANHFFLQQHEFDLWYLVEEILLSSEG